MIRHEAFETWGAGKSDTIISSNEGLSVTYNIYHNVASNLPKSSPTPVLLTPTPQPSPTLTPTPASNLKCWEMVIEQGAGFALIVCSFPDAGISIEIIDPYNNSLFLESGSKLEWGKGGCETYEEFSKHHGEYTVRFLDQEFKVLMNGQFTKLIFDEVNCRG